MSLRHNSAASLFNGLCGFGSVSNDSIDNNTLTMFNAGDHSYYLKISKHISYPLKFGWNIFVKTVTLGGLNG